MLKVKWSENDWIRDNIQDLKAFKRCFEVLRPLKRFYRNTLLSILVVPPKAQNYISKAFFTQTSMYFIFKCLNTLSFHVNSMPTHKFLSPPRILSSPIKQTLKQSNKFSLSLFVIMDMMLLFFFQIPFYETYNSPLLSCVKWKSNNINVITVFYHHH